MEWKDIAKANEEIELITLTQKKKNKQGIWEITETEYAEVKERVIAFRKVFPNGTIDTEIETTENYVIAKTKALDDIGRLLANGYAREPLFKIVDKQKVPNQYAYEVSQTSSVGRCLGFCGFGIKTGIASADDISNVIEPTDIFEGMEDLAKRKEEVIAKFYKLNVKTQADILNVMHKQKAEDIETNMLEELVRNAK